MRQVRYDPERQVYRDCKWCGGRGCIYCKSEADKAYQRDFPNGPQPIATFNLADPGELDAARQSIGADAMRKAFSAGGGGIAEIIANIHAAKSMGDKS